MTNPPTTPNPEAAAEAGTELTHLRDDGSAHMVDVSDKAITKRSAIAQAFFVSQPAVIAQLVEGDLPKGEALGTARIAGILAAKKTPELVPLCHPLPLSKIEVDFEPFDNRIRVVANVTTRGVTGVEMEALTAASVAALTLYDMTKALDRHARIEGIEVIAKSGGKSGDWTAPGAAGMLGGPDHA